MRPFRPSRTAPVLRRNSSASRSPGGSRPTRSAAPRAPAAQRKACSAPAPRQPLRMKDARSSGASGFPDGEEIVGADHQFDREADTDRENQDPKQQPQMF